MIQNLVDRDEILDILDERFGFWEYARDVIARNELDEYEDEMLRLCDDILEGFRNFVETAKVIEERKYTHCILHESEYDTYFPLYHYTCGECGESVDSLHDDEEYRFCSHCGAKYDKIERMN